MHGDRPGWRGAHGPRWTAGEDALLRMMFDGGESDVAMARKLSEGEHQRTWEGVSYRRHRLGLGRGVDHDHVGGDLRFKAAMVAAVRSGAERVPFYGVAKDDTPLPPSMRRYVSQIEARSGGSPAGMCADLANLPWGTK